MLPSPPGTVVDLNSAFSCAEPDLAEVADIVERDVATSAKLLQVVNSAFFGLGHRMTGIASAIAYLGLDTVRNLAISVATLRTIEQGSHIPPTWLGEFHNHSYAVADASRGIAVAAGLNNGAGEIFGAALLHDIGSLVLASRLPDAQWEIDRRVNATGEEQTAVEIAVVGATHCDVGAYLMALWGLPRLLVECAAHHHHPGAAKRVELDATNAVYVAEALHHERPSTPPTSKSSGLVSSTPTYAPFLHPTQRYDPARFKSRRPRASRRARP